MLAELRPRPPENAFRRESRSATAHLEEKVRDLSRAVRDGALFRPAEHGPGGTKAAKLTYRGARRVRSVTIPACPSPRSDQGTEVRVAEASSGKGSSGPKGTGAETSSLEQRLRRLEDRDAIHQVFVDYGHALDFGDFEAFAGLFAEDGEVMLGPLGRARGRAAIRDLMEKVLKGGVGSSYHLIGNPIVRLDGDTATSEVTWAVVARGGDGQPRLTMLGRHVDRLVREEGSWRIAERRGVIDLPSKLPESAGRAGG